MIDLKHWYIQKIRFESPAFAIIHYFFVQKHWLTQVWNTTIAHTFMKYTMWGWGQIKYFLILALFGFMYVNEVLMLSCLYIVLMSQLWFQRKCYRHRAFKIRKQHLGKQRYNLAAYFTYGQCLHTHYPFQHCCLYGLVALSSFHVPEDRLILLSCRQWSVEPQNWTVRLNWGWDANHSILLSDTSFHMPFVVVFHQASKQPDFLTFSVSYLVFLRMILLCLSLLFFVWWPDLCVMWRVVACVIKDACEYCRYCESCDSFKKFFLKSVKRHQIQV